jgi:predicted phage terminase large subunit-like protein
MRLSPKEFKQNLASLARELRAQIEAEVSGFATDPAAQAVRQRRAGADFAFFAKTYFPHYVQHEPSLLHAWLFQRLPALVADPQGKHLAIAAPRGEAKSTLVSLIFVLWCLVFERKRYLLIIMDAFDQATTMLEAVKAELEANPRLAMDFPQATGQGRVWQVGVVVSRNDVKIQVFGSGKRMRGLRHGPHRPDLVIGDDLENDENVRSPEQRDKLESWLKKTVLHLGAADGAMDVVVIGTVLHYDSVLSRLLNNPLWERRRFQALVEWPARRDLWDRFEALLLNDGEAVALAFYQERQEEMERGAVVSWPAARPLVRLMIIRARDGHGSFDSELQNDPVDLQAAAFAQVQFWSEENPRWVMVGAVDPSLGKFGAQRDPSAILVGGYDRQSGTLDVVVAEIAKRLPDLIIERVIALQRQYGCLVWLVENVQFQEFLRTELVRRGGEQGVPVPAVGVTPHGDKGLRIESLQPHVANGSIRFRPEQKTLLEQLRHWPKADHDDGPDALQMLWAGAVARAQGGPVVTTRRAFDRLPFAGY